MNLWTLIPLASCLAFVILFILVIQQAKSKVNRAFAYFLAVAATWSLTSFMLHLNAFPDQALLWNELLVIALIWGLIAYYHFIRAYTNRPAGMGVYVGYTLLLVLAALSLSGNIVQYVSVTDGIIENELGISLYFIGAISLAFIGAVIFQLVRKYRSSTDPIDRNRTMYLIAGWSILVTLTYSNFIPALAGLPIDHIGNLANALIIAYAISRYQLLNTKLVIRRGLTYILLVGALISVSAGVVPIGLELLSESPTSSIILFVTTVTLLVILIARPLKQTLEESIDRVFYRDTYDHRQVLLNFSSKMGNILSMKELAQTMLPATTKALNITKAALLFQDSANDDFVVQFAHPKGKKNLIDKLRFSADSPIMDWLDKKSSPLNPTQIDSIAELKGLWQVEKEQLVNISLGLLHPIKSRGKLIGIIALGKKRSGGLYSHEDIALVAAITNQAGIIIENAHLYAQAKARANADELTGLYNHRYFHNRLGQEIARASRFSTTFSLIILDLDLFKVYNDVYGHLAGDQVLRKVGLAIKDSARSIDIAFRYGGEEFAIILPETRLDDAYQVAERIRRTIESKTSFREMPITASLGIANWPDDGLTKEEIIGRSDAALYRAKQTGRNRTCLSSDLQRSKTTPAGAELGVSAPKFLSIIYTLAATVDAKDRYTYGHSRKVSGYAVILAETMKLPREKVDTIRAAGLLHDIGKIGIPDSILTKPGALSDKEWEPVRTHPELGVEILKRITDLSDCLPAILHHHEHFDGSGYPARLKGTKIPLGARILAIADSYDAITSPRSYRSQLTTEQAIKELKRCAGTQFDPELTEVFCKIIKPATAKRVKP